jgi:hypothetical protein
MIEGTGPGRGVPWWRSGRILMHRWSPGFYGRETPRLITTDQREGRTVAVIETKMGGRA